MHPLVALIVVTSGVVAGLLVLRRRFLMATVSGFSMTPTLGPGDRLLVRRASLSALRPGDIVVVQPDALIAGPRPGTGYVIKRVAAVPGDVIPESVPWPSGRQVPPGWMALLGDNPEASRDSRDYGLVRQDRLVGVVVRPLRRRS